MFQKIEPHSVCAQKCLPKWKMLWLRKGRREGRIFFPLKTTNWKVMMTSLNFWRQGSSAPPLATTAHLSSNCCCTVTRLRIKPYPEATFPTFSEYSLYRRKLFWIVCFYNCLCFQHCQRIPDPQNVSSGVKWSTLRASAQARAFRWADFTQPDRERKWLLWWASAVLLKMWLKTLTKVTLPAVVMSSSLAKLFFIKWQHMTPKSIPNQ